MSRHTSAERRGTIVLLIICAVIILSMTAYRNCSRTSVEATPPILVVMPDTAVIDTMPIVGSHLREKNASRKKKKGSGRKGRQRDYLKEPVGGCAF